MRESATAKARRYLCEGRVVVRELDEHAGVVEVDVRGSGAVHACGARAHIEALRLIVAVASREAGR